MITHNIKIVKRKELEEVQGIENKKVYLESFKEKFEDDPQGQPAWKSTENVSGIRVTDTNVFMDGGSW